MKILHLHTNIASKTGGQTVMMSQIIGVLQNMGHQNIVLTSNSDSDESNLFKDIKILKVVLDFESDDLKSEVFSQIEKFIIVENVEVIFIHYVRNVPLLKKVIEISKNRSLPTIRRIADPNIVCFRNIRASYFSGRQCDQKLGLGCLLKGHFVKFDQNGKLKLINIFSRLTEIAINMEFDVIIVNSKYMSNLLIQHGFSKEKVFTISNMVKFGNNNFDLGDIQEDPRSILFAGNIHKIKGIFYLLDSLKYIKEKVVLRIIGEGKHLNRVKKIALKIKDHEIKFFPYLEHDEMLKFYKQSVLTVMPSLWPESFGLVGIESLFVGKPVVALNVGGISDWMENNKTGYLLDRYTKPIIFAAHIERLLSDPNLAKEMGNYGRQKVLNKYQSSNWEYYLTKFINKKTP